MRLFSKNIFKLISASLVLVFVLLSPALALDHINGKVVHIADGDTITVLSDKKEYKIRLYGIDTPERGQPFGKKAKEFTADMAGMKKVVVDPMDKDRYGRIVGLVYIDGDGECLNEEILRAGFAWVYRYYCKAKFCNKWLKIEKWAQEKEKGLWRDKNPVPPWDWRRGKRSVDNEKEEAPNVYHGNTSSHVFHEPGCRYFDCKNCVKSFETREQAIKAGYEPCGICKP